MKAKENGPRARVCVVCGKYLPKGRAAYCSDECRAESARRRARQNRAWRENKSSVYWEFVCPDCGKIVYGHIKNKRCPDCQVAHNKILRAQYRERQKRGHCRTIGSMDLCQNCGKPYIVEGGMQKYCKICAPVMVKKHDRERKLGRPATEAQRKRRKEDAAHNPRIGICTFCGKEFVRTKGHRTLCSDECKKKANAAAARQYEKNRRERKKEEDAKNGK